MLLKIWTAADHSAITKTFGRTLKAMKPAPPHEFLPLDDNEAHPTPGAGEVILVCGDKALNMLRKASIVPKNRTVSSMRETKIAHQGGHYMVTFDPNVVNSQPEQGQIIDWDVRLAVRLLTTGDLKPVIGKYRWVNSFQPLIDRIEAQYAKTKKAVPVCTDTETETFYPWYEDRDIVSISFSDQPGMAEILYTGKMPPPLALDPEVNLFAQIEWLLTSPKVKLEAGNGKYDFVWIWKKWGIECTNFKFDFILAGNLMDENRSNSLNTLTKVKTNNLGGYDDDFNKKYDKGKMGEINVRDPVIGQEYLTYSGGDTDAGRQVADTVREELLQDQELANFYVNILHPASRAFEKIERRGIDIDLHKFQTLSDELGVIAKQEQKKALEVLPNKMLIKYRERIDDQLKEGKNPLLPSILKEFFFTPHGLNLKPKEFTPKPDKNGDKVPSMAKSHLKMFSHIPAAKVMLDALEEGNSAAKTKSTFVDGFIKHVRPDGKLHPIYMLFHGSLNDDEDDDDSGSTTGRLSAKEPPIQVTPKKTKWAKRIRECFVARPGKVIAAWDYVQGELKVVACIANEKNMIQAYLDGMDLHAVTGARLGEMSYEDFQKLKAADNASKPWVDAPFDANNKTLQGKFDYLRDRAKPANFGLLYGMSAGGLVAYAWATYGLKLTEEEATVIREMFFKLYPGLLDYHADMRMTVKSHGEVRGPLGRVRHLPHIKAWDQEVRARAERQAINAPVQSTLTDMMIWAIALIDAEFGEQVETFAMIHDAIYAYIDEDKVSTLVPQVSQIMSNLPFKKVGWEPQLQFTTDGEYGLDLAHLTKFKLAA